MSRGCDEPMARSEVTNSRVGGAPIKPVVVSGSVWIELRGEGLGSRDPVRLDEAELDPIPVDTLSIQSDADPSSTAGVTREEATHGIGVDHGQVHAIRSSAGQCDNAITMVIIEIPREPFISDRYTEMLIAFAPDLDLNLWQSIEDPADAFSGRGHNTIVPLSAVTLSQEM